MQPLPKSLLKRQDERHFKQEIEALSHDIEARIAESLQPIDEKHAPKEIRPLIHAINRLIFYFEDRSHHEQDFSANASHELRTPLAGIRLQTEIAMSTDDPAIQKKAHHNVLIAIDQNERLIEQLLAIARLTADKVELAMEKVNLSQLSEQVAASLQNLAKEKHINLKLKLTDNLSIIGSEECLSILLHNLIRNAICHIPDGAEIWIRAVTSNKKVILSVTDNGPGIPAEKREMVLRRFQKAANNAKSGSGLGLAIVKRICDLHHATLELNDATEKGGLNVMVTFNR